MASLSRSLKKTKTINNGDDNRFYLYVAGIGNWSNVEDTTLMCKNYDAVKRNIYDQTKIPYDNLTVYYYDPLVDVHGTLVDKNIAFQTVEIINDVIIKKDKEMGITSGFVCDYVPTDPSKYPENYLIIDLANIGKHDDLNILRVGYLGDNITKNIFQYKLFEKYDGKIITIQDKLKDMGFNCGVDAFYNWVARGEAGETDEDKVLSIQREFIPIEREYLRKKKISMKEYNLESAVELLSKIVWCDVTTRHSINMYVSQVAESLMCIMYGY